MQEITVIFWIVILIVSIVIHEVSHGYVANMLGDPTAKYAGRLTLNPLRHLEVMGSFVVPLLTYMAGGLIFGWAKPVPYNPYNLKYQKWGPAFVAMAGPFSNFITALFFGLLVQLAVAGTFLLSPALVEIMITIVFVNVTLMIFNLVPIAPLDGSKILFAVLPDSMRATADFIERYGFILLIIFVFFFFSALSPVIRGVVSIFTGLNF